MSAPFKFVSTNRRVREDRRFVVGRGNYTELGPLLITAALLGLLIPIAAIALFGRRV